jgi:hypothetical protein
MKDILKRDLHQIKSFIVRHIGKLDKDGAFMDYLDKFLQRLIDPIERGKVEKDPMQIKAGRQLLCSIGIDIKSKLVPLKRYHEIFKKIDFLNEQRQARLLFHDVLNKHKLYYRDSSKKETSTFSVMVCPMKDWHYYIDRDVLGLHGIDETRAVRKTLIDYTSAGRNVSLKNRELNKHHDFSYFWITTHEDIDDIVQQTDSATAKLVDRLGMSHFDFLRDENRLYFYIDLGTVVLETFKPNATIVNWENPLVGFLSTKDHISGRTFPISGYRELDGFRERVFHITTLDENQINYSRIFALKDEINSPIPIEHAEIIQEGIKRFKVRPLKTSE